MSLFLTAFAASALAQIMFARPNEKLDLSDIKDSIKSLDDGINQLAGTIDRNQTQLVQQLNGIADSTTFMKARMCLQDFNPKLLGTPKIGPHCHSVEAIQAAATEGFNMLMELAIASENGYPDATKRFDDTYGNQNWVQEQFGSILNEYKQFELVYNKQKQWLVIHQQKTNEIFTQVHNNMVPIIWDTYQLCIAIVQYQYYSQKVSRLWKTKKLLSQIQTAYTNLRGHIAKLGRLAYYLPEYERLMLLVKHNDIEKISTMHACCFPHWLHPYIYQITEELNQRIYHNRYVYQSPYRDAEDVFCYQGQRYKAAFTKLADLQRKKLPNMQLDVRSEVDSQIYARIHTIMPAVALPDADSWSVYTWEPQYNITRTLPHCKQRTNRTVAQYNKKLINAISELKRFNIIPESARITHGSYRNNVLSIEYRYHGKPFVKTIQCNSLAAFC